MRLTLTFVLMGSASVAAETTLPRTPDIFLAWQDANKASIAAIDAEDYARAAEASKTAAELYVQQAETYRADTYLVLIDNAARIIYHHRQDTTDAAEFLFKHLNEAAEISEEQSEKFVELGLLLGRFLSSTRSRTTVKDYYKERAALLEIVEDNAKRVHNGYSEEALMARYNVISMQRAYVKPRRTRKDFEALLEKCLEIKAYQPALRTVSALAGTMAVAKRDYEDALDLIKRTIEEIGEDNIPERYSQNIFAVVAATLFLDHGPDKTETMLKELPGLAPAPLKVNSDGDIDLIPLRRYSPNFRNITSNVSILLQFDVSRKGKPRNIQILSSDLSRANEGQAKEAIATWRYLPAFKDGRFEPVEKVRVVFNVRPPS